MTKSRVRGIVLIIDITLQIYNENGEIMVWVGFYITFSVCNVGKWSFPK